MCFVKIGVVKAVLLLGVNEKFSDSVHFTSDFNREFSKGNVHSNLFVIVCSGT